jgi:hypothetical protein
MDLTFRYRVLHVTPLRMDERGETNKKMQEFRNHMKPEEEIPHCTRRKRMNRRMRRRIRKKRRYDTASKSNKTNAFPCYRNPL